MLTTEERRAALGRHNMAEEDRPQTIGGRSQLRQLEPIPGIRLSGPRDGALGKALGRTAAVLIITGIMRAAVGSAADRCRELIERNAFLIEITAASATKLEVLTTRAEDGVIACQLLGQFHGAKAARVMAPESIVERGAVIITTTPTGDQFHAGCMPIRE